MPQKPLIYLVIDNSHLTKGLFQVPYVMLPSHWGDIVQKHVMGGQRQHSSCYKTNLLRLTTVCREDGQLSLAYINVINFKIFL